MLIVRWPGHIQAGTVSNDLVSTIDLGPAMLSAVGLPIPLHMQGQPFLGSRAKPPRTYVFAARDRYDESYDMMRAVRDSRFKYIRNYRPELPYLLWIPYRNRHPILEEMWRLYARGELRESQLLMFQNRRPVEELYDTQADPYEIHNLADDPKEQENLQRLRRALDEWLEDVGDMGRIPETEMVRRWYPDGVQPQTAPVVFVPIAEPHAGRQPSVDNVNLPAPALLQMHCATQGASIAYTFEEGDDVHWELYTGPLCLPAGTTALRAVAIRIGYKESEQRRLTVTVENSDAVTQQ